MRINVAAVGLNRDSLHNLGNGNGGDQRVVHEVENADGASMHVGGIRATSIRGYDEHMRFRLAGGILRDHFASGGVDGVERLGKLGGHVKLPVRSNAWLVRAQGFAEVDGVGEFALANINHINAGAVGSRLADTGVSVDRNVSIAAILAHGDLVAVDADDDFGDLATGLRINEQSGVLELIRDDQESARGRTGAPNRARKKQDQRKGSNDGWNTGVHQAPRLPCQLNKLGKQADYSRGNRCLPTLCLVSRW